MESSALHFLTQVLHYPSSSSTMREDILIMLRCSFESSRDAQKSFKEFNGANSLLSMSLDNENDEIYDLWLETIISAVKDYDFYLDQDKIIRMVKESLSSRLNKNLGAFFAFCLCDKGLINMFHFLDNENRSDYDISKSSHLVHENIAEKIKRTRGCTLSPKLLESSVPLMCGLDGMLQFCVVQSLYQISRLKMEFFSLMHKSSLPISLISFYFKNFVEDEAEIAPLLNETLLCISKLLKTFFEKGVNLEVVKYLLKNYQPQEGSENIKEDTVMDFLNDAFSCKTNTGYFYFEAADRNGYLQVSDFKKPFPPQSGYSLVFWIYLETIDTTTGVSILKFIDESNDSSIFDLSCSPDFRLKLETSNRSVLLNYQFQPYTWYHIALTHLKPLLTSHNSKFFVNGSLIETIKIGYMGQAGGVKKVKTIIGPSESHFSNANSSIWGLGSLLFLEEISLEDADILYMFKNSQEFSGNWQGAATADHSITEVMVEGDQTNAVTAISSYVFSPFSMREYVNIKEDKILLSIFAESDINFLLKEYEKEQRTSNYLGQLEKYSGKVLNLSNCQMTGSVPNLIDRRGEIIAINFENIFNGIWRLGGVNVLIRLIDRSLVCIFS